MRRKLYKNQGKIYFVIWTVILMISVYITFRYISLTLADDIDHAKDHIGVTIMSNLSINIMEAGSSLVSFTAKEDIEAYSFPIKQFANEFALSTYVKENEFKTVINNYTPVLSQDKKTSKSIKGIHFQDFTKGYLPREYVLTNGALFYNDGGPSGDGNSYSQSGSNDLTNELVIGILDGEIEIVETEDKDQTVFADPAMETINTNKPIIYSMEQLKDINFLVRNFYIVDRSTKITESLFDAEKLLSKNMTMKKNQKKPQILIYHTHSQEAYIDSRSGKASDTVVGVGAYLAKILEEEYGYKVIHDTTTYDIVNGSLDRNKAYNAAKPSIEKILKDNPSIEVVIDLHRDGAGKRSTMLNGEETAQIMLFNGLSRDQNGPITYLDNPNLQNNLAFSLQLQLKSLELYPGLFYKNYLKCYRYNMHVRAKSLLVELGTDKNTLQSAKNAMVPFAEILDSVLQGK